MQQLWFSKPASPVPVFAKPNKPAAKSILKSSKPCFSFYVDESCLENFKSSDEDKPLDLTFKLGNLSEEDGGAENVGQSTASKLSKTEALGGVRKKIGITNTIKQSTNDKENCFFKENFDPIKVLPELKIDDDDKENGIPDNYCGPIGKSNRKVSGILTPAENIEIAQLSDEEVI